MIEKQFPAYKPMLPPESSALFKRVSPLLRLEVRYVLKYQSNTYSFNKNVRERFLASGSVGSRRIRAKVQRFQ
jgi:hypothetical protein